VVRREAGAGHRADEEGEGDHPGRAAGDRRNGGDPAVRGAGHGRDRAECTKGNKADQARHQAPSGHNSDHHRENRDACAQTDQKGKFVISTKMPDCKLFEPLRGQRDPGRTDRDHRRCLRTSGEGREEFGDSQRDARGENAGDAACRMTDPLRFHTGYSVAPAKRFGRD
jgi:hypothetical protein